MKKLLLVLLLFSLTVSCSKDDNNSKDPFIGTWYLKADNGVNSDGTWIINSNGTFILNDLDSGNWLNKSSNLNSKNQDYQLAFSACEEVCIQSYSITFSSDFDSGTFSITYDVDFQTNPYTQGYSITRISD
tara:strand:+ start:3125 stop:3517 length:393 start_codon:yes stop_codon:yes gene_type:complete